MDTINELAADERTARIILAYRVRTRRRGDGADDPHRRRIRDRRPRLADEVPPGPDGDTWQRRLAPRIDAAQTERVLAETERHGMRVLIPGDAEWPAGIDALGDRAPVALWAKGNRAADRPVWDRLTITGAGRPPGMGSTSRRSWCSRRSPTPGWCSPVARMGSMVPRTVPRSPRAVQRSPCLQAAWTGRIRQGTLIC
jgi:hypothetical protein